MFDRLTDGARRVLVVTKEEARALGHGYLGSEHLLLGLLAEGEGLAVAILVRNGVALPQLRRRVLDALGRVA